MNYVTMSIREDDVAAVKRFIRQRRAKERAAAGKQPKKAKPKPPKLAARFWKSNKKRVSQYVAAGEDQYQWEEVIPSELKRWAALGQPIDDTEFNVFCRRRGLNAAQKSFLKEALDYIGLKG